VSETALYALYALLAVGAGGLYLGLPSLRPDARRLRVAGAIMGAGALAGTAAYLVNWIGPGFAGRGFFVIFAAAAIVAAGRVVTHARPVYCAMYFVLVVLAVTGLCILAAAEFLGAALVIIYGGAILVTYVFVIMLAQQVGQASYDQRAREPLAAVLMGFLVAAAAAGTMTMREPFAGHAARPRSGYRYVVGRAAEGVASPGAEGAAGSSMAAAVGGAEAPVGNTRAVGQMLMTTYVMAVEVAGVLLLVAVVGAIAIARKRIEPEALTAEERRLIDEKEDVHRRGREAAPF
jgi:NADH-quinone oxidoreductase subunit J